MIFSLLEATAFAVVEPLESHKTVSDCKQTIDF